VLLSHSSFPTPPSSDLGSSCEFERVNAEVVANVGANRERLDQVWLICQGESRVGGVDGRTTLVVGDWGRFDVSVHGQAARIDSRSEEHTSELQSRAQLV